MKAGSVIAKNDDQLLWTGFVPVKMIEISHVVGLQENPLHSATHVRIEIVIIEF